VPVPSKLTFCEWLAIRTSLTTAMSRTNNKNAIFWALSKFTRHGHCNCEAIGKSFARCDVLICLLQEVANDNSSATKKFAT